MRKFAAFSALALATALILGACGKSDADGTFALRFATYNVPDAAESLAQKEWAKRVEKATDGRVTIEFFYQEALLTAAETLPGVADGRADMGWVATGYYPAELPLTNVVGVPFVSTNPSAAAKALPDLMERNKALQAEWEAQGVKVLNWSPSSANIVASKSPIASLSDLKGKKVRGYGYISEALKRADANVIGLSQPEVYEGLQRGVLDATSGAALNIAVDRKFQEVASHFVGLGFGSYATTADVISLKKWNSFPADIREAILSVSTEHPGVYAEFLHAEEDKACKALIAAGGEATIIDTADVQAWRATAGPQIQEIWAKDVLAVDKKAKPLDFFDEYEAVIGKYEAEEPDYIEPMARCAAAGQ